jgi:hypothetical protein
LLFHFSSFGNLEIAMQILNNKFLFQSLVLLSLILASLACGSTATTPVPAASVEDTPVEAEPTATEAAASGPAGTSPENPAARTETVSTADWEISVVEVHRGKQAAATLDEASAFNDPHPDPAMEYVVVKVHAKYAGTDSGTHRIDGTFFQSMDSAGVLYDRVKITDVDAPNPSISSFDDLTAGGEVEGWVVIQVRKDDPDILLVIQPRDNGLALGPETIRYISLVE